MDDLSLILMYFEVIVKKLEIGKQLIQLHDYNMIVMQSNIT